jgi:hypothetical protein
LGSGCGGHRFHMDTLRIVIAGTTVLVVVGLLAFFVLRNSPGRGNTEAPTTDEHRDSPSDRFYATSGGPAGPGAEDMYVSEAGSIGPGPTGHFDPASEHPPVPSRPHTPTPDC